MNQFLAVYESLQAESSLQVAITMKPGFTPFLMNLSKPSEDRDMKNKMEKVEPICMESV